MLSAFGVEHGDSVSKALPLNYRLVRLPKGFKGPGGKRPTQAQIRTRGTNPGAPTRPQRLMGALNRAGDTPVTIKGIGRTSGRAGKAVSSAIENHSGLAGTALVGGGGAAGYHHLKNKEPRKKKS